MRWESQAVTFVSTWKPIGIIAGTLLSGLLLGIIVGLFSCSSSETLAGAKEEAYLVLAATLYSQGESLGAMKVYLNSFASHDPAPAMLQLSEKYEKSGDRKKQQQAKDLRQLGDALKLGREPEPLRTAAAVSPPTLPLITATAVPPQQAPAANAPAPSQPTSPSAAPKPASGPPPTPISGRGVARPSGGGGAIMREQPSTKSVQIGSLSNGAQVEIVRVVEGEAVDPAEPRWYLVKFESKTGYVYFKLIVPAE